MGKNWNSKISQYTDIVRDTTKKRAEKAETLREMGVSVKDIARQINKSTSRVYEYLKK